MVLPLDDDSIVQQKCKLLADKHSGTPDEQPPLKSWQSDLKIDADSSVQQKCKLLVDKHSGTAAERPP